jgi:lactoylglutathione lyase
MTTNSPVPDSTEPEFLRGSALSASLTVKDVGKSLAWYKDVVGFAIERKYEREGKLTAVALKAGDVRVLIVQDDGAKGWNRVKGEGFSLLITTEQNIDDIARRIKELGGTLESEPADMPWGPRVFRLQDPDGFKFAISSPIR